MTGSIRAKLGFFAIPDARASTLRPLVDAALESLDDSALDTMNRVYLDARTAAAHSWETDRPGEVGSWTALSTYLRQRLGEAFEDVFVDARKVPGLRRALEDLDQAKGGPDGIVRDLTRRQRDADADAVREVYRRLLEAAVAADQHHHALLLGRWYAAPAGEDGDDDGAPRVPTAADEARLDRWLDSHATELPPPGDRHGFFAVPADQIEIFGEVITEKAADTSPAARTAREREVYELARGVALDAAESSDPQEREAFYEYSDWLRREEPGYHGFGVYTPAAARNMLARLRALEHQAGGPSAVAAAVQTTGHHPAELVRRVHAAFSGALAAACERGAAFVVARSLQL